MLATPSETFCTVNQLLLIRDSCRRLIVCGHHKILCPSDRPAEIHTVTRMTDDSERKLLQPQHGMLDPIYLGLPTANGDISPTSE